MSVTTRKTKEELAKEFKENLEKTKKASIKEAIDKGNEEEEEDREWDITGHKSINTGAVAIGSNNRAGSMVTNIGTTLTNIGTNSTATVVQDSLVSHSLYINTGLKMEWSPKPDITAYELALAIPYILGNSIVKSEDDITEPFFRHFEFI